MAAQTLKEQVAGLTKNTPTSDDLLTSFFNDGYKDIVNRLGMINKKDLHKFAINDITYTTATSGSLIIGEQYKIITFVTGDNFTNVGGTNITGNVFVASGTTPTTWTGGSTLIRRFNTEDVIEILRVARGDYVSMEVDALVSNELETGSLYAPTAKYPKYYMLDSYLIIVPEPTSTAKGTISKIILPTITVSGTSIDYFPAKYLHLIVLYASVKTLQYRAINYSLPDDLILPVLPSVVTLGTISSSLPTFTAPAGVVLPNAPSDSTISFTTVDIDKPSWADPSGIVLPVLDLSGITLTITEFTTPTAPTAPSSPIIDKGEITLPTSSIPVFTMPVCEVDMSDFDTAYDEDDIELAAIDVQKQTQLLQKYQVDIQNSLHKFNEDNVQYQAELQKAIQEATNSMSSDVQQFSGTLQKYSAQLQGWQIEVNSELTEWQQDIVQTAVLTYTTQRANSLQQHQIDTTSELGRYTNNLNKEAQEYQTNLSKWGQLITRELGKYQAETGYDVSKFTAEIQGIIQKHAQDLQSAVQDFTEEAQKYSLETQSVASANNSLLTDYQAKLGAYNAELGSNVQDFNTSLQKIQLDYGWIINQIKLLAAEYEKGFVPFQQPQQSEGAK